MNLSGNIEKNLRKDTPEEIVIELENIVFNVQIHPHIKNDIFELYLSQKKSISLKSLWIYLWDELKLLKNYDHDVFDYRQRLLPIKPTFLPPNAKQCTTVCHEIYHVFKYPTIS